MAPKPEASRSPARVGLIYDERMCRHADPGDEDHPEDPERIRAIWRKLESEGITQRCVVLKAKEADDKQLELVHSKNHVKLIKNISSREFDSRRYRMSMKYNSIYFNEGSSEAAYLAAGSVVEVAEKVAKGDLTSAIAIVRPPGHHAIPNAPMGFCLFNNVAVAASYLLNEKPELGIKKILIVDWDVHHGNGTQDMFYQDPRVLFFSVHRFDFGTFYPTGDNGAYHMIGEGPGVGYNINIPWEHGRCGDADYVAVWDYVLIPVAKAYNPDIILVSAGFDAAVGDPLGGCCITPDGYSILLQKLMQFARGKIVMALEGGYNLKSISNSILACVEVLLEDNVPLKHLKTHPYEATWRVIEMVRRKLAPYWPVLGAKLPKDKPTNTNKPGLMEYLYYNSESDAETEEASSSISAKNSVEFVEDSVIIPLSKLDLNEDSDAKLVTSTQVDGTCVSSETRSNVLPTNIIDGVNTWRSVLSKVEVWYASYGSNMWKPRFMCYIKGGKVEGMKTSCCGSLDKSFPKEVMWKIVPHQLFFGRSYTRTWGSGGVAFLHPESNINTKAHIAMYRITLEQFNDVLIQENCLHQEDGKLEGTESPLFDLSILDYVVDNGSVALDTLKDGWYFNVLYLGKEDNIPILTMTCTLSDIKRFRSGEVPLCAPPIDYMDTLVNGLVEGGRLTREEAINYINGALSPCEL